MKKIKLILCCFIITGANAFALWEDYSSIGFSYLNDIYISEDNIHSSGRNVGFLGLNIDAYEFWNAKNIGLFMSANVLASLYAGGTSGTYSGFKANLYLGPGFRHSFNNRITLLYGCGLGFDGQEVEVTNGRTLKNNFLNIGAAGDAALKFDITNVVFVKFGVTASYTFARYSSEPFEWAFKSKIGINPFIGIGANSYNDSFQWGKPNEGEQH